MQKWREAHFRGDAQKSWELLAVKIMKIGQILSDFYKNWAGVYEIFHWLILSWSRLDLSWFEKFVFLNCYICCCISSGMLLRCEKRLYLIPASFWPMEKSVALHLIMFIISGHFRVLGGGLKPPPHPPAKAPGGWAPPALHWYLISYIPPSWGVLWQRPGSEDQK